jgi:hypothetical protein
LGTVGSNIDQDKWLRAVERAQQLLSAFYEEYDRYVEPPALLTGTDLMRGLGLGRGRLIGELLMLIREAQVKGDVITAEDAMRLARRHVSSDHHNTG